MNGIADRRLAGRIVERLASGPAEITELLAALRPLDGDVLRGQEGAVHALMHRLVRDGRVRPVGHAASGGAIYAADAGPAAGPAADSPAAPVRDAPPPSPAAAIRLATRVAGPLRDPIDRGRVVADVLAHHAALARADELSRFGPWKLARGVMARADRGRSLLAVAENGWERLRRFALLEGPALVATLAVLAVLWLFVAEFRVIPTHSMEPVFHPGDRVIVRKLFGRSKPERFSIVVFHGATDVLVKRVVGLPGESVRIEQGDVFVDGVRAVKPEALDAEVREPVWREGPESDADWVQIGGTSPVLRRMTRALFADLPRYTDRTGQPEPLRSPRPICHDVYLTARTSGVAALALEFTAEGGEAPANDVASVEWRRSDSGAETVTLRKSAFLPRGEADVVAQAGGGAGGPATIAVIDGVLWVDSGVLHVRRPIDVPKGRVRPVTGGGFSEVAIDRDLHWTSDPEAAYAVDGPYVVPEGKVFLLGDHSSNSRDSRFQEVGAIPLERLIGPVIFRVWPPTRIGIPR